MQNRSKTFTPSPLPCSPHILSKTPPPRSLMVWPALPWEGFQKKWLRVWLAFVIFKWNTNKIMFNTLLIVCIKHFLSFVTNSVVYKPNVPQAIYFKINCGLSKRNVKFAVKRTIALFPAFTIEVKFLFIHRLPP